MIRLRYLTLSVLAVLIVVSIVPFVLSYEYGDADFTVPSWIKNNAGWWADEQIDDSSFVSGIQWLITNDVIILPPTELGTGDSENVIPRWVKTTAGWWADDEINVATFVAAIKYLIGEGIIIIEREQVEESEKCTFKGIEVDCQSSEYTTEEIKEFHIAVNEASCRVCLNWAYVGEQYKFQVETFDEFRGSPIDGVTITAKIISKDGELRYNLGQVITEDGIYKGSITIPSMDWYAENILSVTGKYYGVEKTIEKEFEVFTKKHLLGTWLVEDIETRDAETDGANSFTELKGAHSVAIFTIDSNTSTYAIVTAQSDDGVQIIDISDPTNIVARDAETDGANSFTRLDGARNVATYTITAGTESALSLTSKNYAIVAGLADNGLQIIDIGIPTGIVAKDAEVDGVNGFDKIEGVYGVATFGIHSNSTYRGAVVTSNTDDSVIAVDITNPTAIFEHDVEIDGANSFTELEGARGVATWNSTSNTYAIVVSQTDDGVQIIDINDPSGIVAKDAETDGVNGFTELDGANGVAIWNGSKTTTYAIVASIADDGVQIIDISDPTNIIAIDAETDGSNGFTELDGAASVDTFTCGNRTYAIVVSNIDDGIQLIDVTAPSNIVAIDAETDGSNGFTELDAPRGVATFTIGTSIYAIVTSLSDDGVQIIEFPCNRG